MKTIAIGIHAYAESQRLNKTLAALSTTTSHRVEILLLPDGPDEETRRTLAGLSYLPRSATSEPRGAAACFNRLINGAAADVYILLESGSVVGPGWLDYLLAALDADPRNGLSGPSTNRVWNEQGIFPQAAGTPEAINHTAREAARRYGPEWRELTPLHSLADFCYAVRREVIESIGAADEGYGLGPCWEMDYNIRAARAGWRGVWACGAYVYRHPFATRRAQTERLLFEASKHRYQDKFCGLRLNGVKKTYESHCRGEACEFFAPLSKIPLFIPYKPSPSPAAKHSSPLLESIPDRHAVVSLMDTLPLVTCIMPTRDRLDYVLQSIRYFQRQDYPEKELIIVDDGSIDIAKALPNDTRIRVLRSSQPKSIGAKRNWACEVAKGQIIAQWDDDDFYGSARLSAQIAPLLEGKADVTGLITDVIFDLPNWRFWRLSPDLHKRLFVGDVHGGTLVFWRKIWKDFSHYPDRSMAEDAFFLTKAMSSGARLVRLASNGNFIYLRHSTNSWAFECGRFIDPGGWRRVSESSLAPEDRAFYASHCTATPTSPPENTLPLVSAIMPTYNRRHFVPRAIEYFLRQEYEPKELLILDDGTDPISDLVPDHPQIRYLRLDKKLTLGAKLNLACENASGEIIAHWDDDDWYAPHRLRYQVHSLTREHVDVCGLNNLLYYDIQTGHAYKYVYPPEQRIWLLGSELCYYKDFWKTHRFAEIQVGMDAKFVWSAHPRRVLALSDCTFAVHTIHASNISPKQPRGAYWKPYATETIRKLLSEDWPFYQSQSRR